MPARLADVVDAGPVRLRRLCASDAPALVTASLPELAPWFEWAQTPPELGEERARLAQADRAFENGDDYEFAIIEPDTGVFVGGLRLNPAAGPRTAGIGYWVRSDRHRRGYASATTRAHGSRVRLGHHQDPLAAQPRLSGATSSTPRGRASRGRAHQA